MTQRKNLTNLTKFILQCVGLSRSHAKHAEMAYGFRNTDSLIAMVMLFCSGVQPRLPGR